MPETLQNDVFLLRRLNPKQWDRKENKVLPAAFVLRDGEPGLSLFAEGRQTPRSLLQKLLNEQREKFHDQPQKLQNWLQSNGTTVEEMVSKNWRVARVSRTAFPPSTFSSTQQEENGHLEMRGTSEDFEKYSSHIARQARLCSPKECTQ